MKRLATLLPTAKGMTPQRGVTLIEVLVAIVVLSVGLLGMAGLQVSSLRANQSAYIRTQAVSQAYDILDEIRADLPNWQTYNGRNYDLSATFPSGLATVAVNNFMLTVTVSWDDSAVAGGAANERVAVTTMMVAQ
jgi:type IV pilus assembly protein PilV